MATWEERIDQLVKADKTINKTELNFIKEMESILGRPC